MLLIESPQLSNAAHFNGSTTPTLEKVDTFISLVTLWIQPYSLDVALAKEEMNVPV